MKQSTIDILNETMNFNTEVQEDQLNLQDQCQMLCHFTKELQCYIDLSKDIKEIEGTKDATSKCDKYVDSLKNTSMKDVIKDYASLESLERPTYLYNQIKQSNKANIDRISNSLLNMLESSITDLNKKVNSKSVKKIDNIKTVTYNYNAIDNIATSLSEMLTNICKLGCENAGYKQLRSKFAEQSELNIVVLNTSINRYDYTSMQIPTPKFQSIEEAELSVGRINNISNILNNIVSSENIRDLNTIKYGIANRLLSDDKTDAIKSIHFISQIVMAIKNSIITLQNYHKALLNEIK